MDGLISRKFLIEAFKEEFYGMYSDDFNYMIKWFENLPAVDSFEFCDQFWKIAYEHGKWDAQPSVVTMKLKVDKETLKKAMAEPTTFMPAEIVHCKDCRWWLDPDEPDGCARRDGLVTAKANSFCSYGERKSDG